MDSFSLLSLLADGEYHSGSELGDHLGVSRTAVWKALSKLDDWGLSIESHKGKGYRIQGGLDLIDQAALFDSFSREEKKKIALTVLNNVDSTNQFLLQSVQLNKHEYACLLAEQQTMGRGRRGREWVSPPARNIYFSCGFEFDGGAEHLAGLSLVAGVAVAEALQVLGVRDVSLKWPNDVLLKGRKLAGILVELRAEPTTVWQVVVGVGLNVHMDAQQGVKIDQPWIALSEQYALSRNDVASALVKSIVECMDDFRLKGFGHFLERWNRLDALVGRQVGVMDSQISGVAKGVDRAGALLLETVDGLLPLNAGEVSVRQQ